MPASRIGAPAVSTDEEAEPEAVPVESDDPDWVAVPVEEPVAEAPLPVPVALAVPEAGPPVVVASALRLSVQTATSETAPAYCGQAEKAENSTELLSAYHDSTSLV